MVRKWAMQKFYIEWFNLKKLFKVEGKEKHEFKMSNNFAAMEILDVDVDICRAWETSREYKKLQSRESVTTN